MEHNLGGRSVFATAGWGSKMLIKLECACGKTYQVADEYAGKKAKCRACGAVLLVPDVPSSAPVAPDAELPPPVGESRQRSRSSRPWVIAGSAAAVVLVVTVALLLLDREKSASTSTSSNTSSKGAPAASPIAGHQAADLGGFAEDAGKSTQNRSAGLSPATASRPEPKPEVTKEAPPDPNAAKLMIVTIPSSGVTVRVLTGAQLLENAKAKFLWTQLSGRPVNEGDLMFDAAFAGEQKEAPCTLSLSQGTYVVSVEVSWSKTKGPSLEIGGERLTHVFANSVGKASFRGRKTVTYNNTGVVDRAVYEIEITPRTTALLPVYVLPLGLSVEEALACYPKEEQFKIREDAAVKVLQARGADSERLSQVISGLKRAAIVHTEGKDGKDFFVQLNADGSVSFVDLEPAQPDKPR